MTFSDHWTLNLSLKLLKIDWLSIKSCCDGCQAMIYKRCHSHNQSGVKVPFSTTRFTWLFPRFSKVLIGLLRRHLRCDWLWLFSFATATMKTAPTENSMFIYQRNLTFLIINCSRGVFFLTNLGTNLNCAWASVVLPKIPIVTGQEDNVSSVNNLH